MNNKIKSVLVSCLAVSMLFSACGETEAKKDNKDEKKENSVSASEYKFNFSGINDMLDYAKNSFSTLGNSLNGDINASVSTDLNVKLGKMLTEEFGYDIGEIAISNNAKVKDSVVANDLTLKYNNKSLASLNCIVDSEGVGYVKIPELSDDYIKANLIDLIESETGISLEEIMPSSDTFAIPEEFEKVFEAFDEEKISELFETYLGIIEKNIPDSSKGEDFTGKINDLEYTYETKEYKIDGKIAFDCVSELLDEVKNDKEIAALWNEIVDMQKKEAMDSGYYTDAEIEEYYPSFETSINEYIEEFKKEKDDLYSSDDLMIINVFYDGDRVMGFNTEEDGEKLTIAMIDEKTSFGVGLSVVDVSDDEDEDYTYSVNTQIGFTIEGEDGKFDGKLAYTSECSDSDNYTSNNSFELTFDTDVEVVDEKTGAFKGDINLGMDIDGTKAGLTISSNSTADKSDVTYTAKYNDEEVITIGIVNVVTDATDITIPSKAYDFSNETELNEYSQKCDLEGFLTNLQDVLGEELYDAIFNSSYEDEDWDYDDDFDWNDDDWSDWDYEEEYDYIA